MHAPVYQEICCRRREGLQAPVLPDDFRLPRKRELLEVVGLPQGHHVQRVVVPEGLVARIEPVPVEARRGNDHHQVLIKTIEAVLDEVQDHLAVEPHAHVQHQGGLGQGLGPRGIRDG
eukprot:CAMPEP_0182875384 /NCGR_PEP_ID=MMETSP0034_2-20130328/13509_1 /TAXON_ID=156128 /ORGANISM="Nephroselmis pyriformis, Strain CCMP717" /LENGTH=117 /DNA_ID=CAMNT_0025008119 /DNA_START=153 /DNA_END=503 /DNA_ORIENTATION=-